MKPLSVGELLDAAFSAVRRNFGQLILCTLVFVVPIEILNTLILASSSDVAFIDFGTTTYLDGEQGTVVAARLSTQLLSSIASTLATGACLRAIGGEVVGSSVGAGVSLSYALRRFGPLVWIAVLYALALIVGFLMCIVGLPWLGVLFSMAPLAMIFEDKRGRAAMRRSQQLIADHWWRVFATLAVGYLILIVLSLMLGALFSGVLLADSDNELLNAAVGTAIAIAATALTAPFISALLAYVYFDLRVRKEGFDLALLARGIGGAEAASPVEGLPPSDTPPSTGFLPPQAPPPSG